MNLDRTKPKQFTWKELSKLNDRSNAHVAYEGKVYDVSSFISRHPGGSEQILAGAGRDITQLFKSYHKDVTFERVLSKYYVGELVDNELPVFNRESQFHKLVKQRVAMHLKEHNLDPKYDLRMFATYFFIAFTYLLFLSLSVILYNYNPVYSFVFTVLKGLLSTLVGGTLHHDSSHFAITHQPIVWRAVNVFASCLIGISSYVWYYQHIIGHHSYTNIDGVDPDTDTGIEPDEKAIYRIKKSQSWAIRFTYQHIYMPFLYCLQTFRMKLLDFKFIHTQEIGLIRMNPLTMNRMIDFWIGKLGHIAITFIIPSMFIPLKHVLILYVLFEITCSASFIQLTQLNHVSDEVSWPVVDKSTNEVTQDWAELQVAATQDYCTDSWFWTFIACSLNHQTAHHLFPGYIQSHYRWITPIIKKTCQEMDIKYNSATSILEVLTLHYKFLKRMGDPTKLHST